MAIVKMELFSKCLRRSVPVMCILPVEGNINRIGLQSSRPFKTLYLLNEMLDGSEEQLAESGIVEKAMRYGLAVIIPIENHCFYVDNELTGEQYGKFIGEELIELTRNAFQLSKRRDDTYIAGFSMGGYGAFCNGLKYADTFGCIAGIASSFILEELIEEDGDDSHNLFRRDFLEKFLGDLDKVICSDKDYKSLYIRQKESGILSPKIYMACGREDELLECNRDYRDFLLENGGDVTYEEGPGKHDFNFWSHSMLRVMDWLPLERGCCN